MEPTVVSEEPTSKRQMIKNETTFSKIVFFILNVIFDLDGL